MEFDASLLMHRTDDIKLAMEAERRSLMTLHCEQCNTVLGDSLGVCGELKSLDSILCLKVTHDVIISQDMESVLKGEMAHCICSSLKCSGCRRVLGTVIHSAPQHLAMLRSIFLLHKANISCYILNSSTMVKASTLSFDMKPIGESINEVFILFSRIELAANSVTERVKAAAARRYYVRRQFQAQFNQMSRIKKRLAERSAASEMH